MKSKIILFSILMAITGCSCSNESKIVLNENGKNLVEEKQITNIKGKKFFRISDDDNSGIISKHEISLDNASFYYFYDNVCTYWERIDSSVTNSAKYNVTISYCEINDNVLFTSSLTEDGCFQIVSLNKIEDLTQTILMNFYFTVPRENVTTFELLFKISSNLLIFQENSRLEIYSTKEVGEELGIVFVN